MVFKWWIYLGLIYSSSFLFGQCATNNLTTTFASNNAQSGNIFDVVALTDIEIQCFDSHFAAGTLNYQIYYRLGTGIGFENTPGAWFLAGSRTTVSAGPGLPTVLNIAAPIQVCAGSRVAFYITNTGGSSPNAQYTNGTVLGALYIANANLQIFEGFGKLYPFSSSFSPRVWNGRIRYNNITLCTPLPVELVKFDAMLVDHSVELRWETATEKNNDYFTLEKSRDGVNWVNFGKVAGAGNSTVPTAYKFSDNYPFGGVSYYRLKQTDFDGAYDYSDIRSVDYYSKKNKLTIYPNPAENTIKISLADTDQTEINIFDLCGKKLNHLTTISEVNEELVEMDVSQLSIGVYVLRIGDLSDKITIKR